MTSNTFIIYHWMITVLGIMDSEMIALPIGILVIASVVFKMILGVVVIRIYII